MMDGAGVELDDLDIEILNALMEDGRQSFRQVAEDVDSTPATVINRVERMQDEGVITGFSADVDFQQVGYQAMAAIEVIVSGDDISAVEDLVVDHDNVVSGYSITGDTDILLIVKFETREALTAFVKDQLVASESVEKTITHMVLDTLCEDRSPAL